jgi:hypothetical protein
MSRAEKLIERLSHLENEYLKLVRAEFQMHSDGFSSPWLGRFPSYRRKPAPDDPLKVEMIDKLERDIIRTRRGLGEPDPGPAIAIAREFHRMFDALGVCQTDGDWIRLAREALAKTEALQHLTGGRGA